MKFLRNGLICLFISIGGCFASFAQSSDSFLSDFKVDIGYSFPIYNGEFSGLSGSKSFVERSGTSPIDLLDSRQFNQSNVYGSVSAQISDKLGARLRISQTTFFFAEEIQANVSFKNTIFDISLMSEFLILDSFIKSYIYFGPGINFHKDARIFNNSLDAQIEPNTERTTGISGTLGLGFEYDIGKRFALFFEAEYFNTGSDRIDGYNGFEIENDRTVIREEEDSYLQRDFFLNIGGGIRLKMFKKDKPVPERPVDRPLSSYVANPDSTTKRLSDDTDALTAGERKLDIKGELSGGYTIKVNIVLTLDELRRQRKIAETVANAAIDSDDIKILLLKEPDGYSVHFGYYNDLRTAKEKVLELRKFYSDITIRNYGD